MGMSHIDLSKSPQSMNCGITTARYVESRFVDPSFMGKSMQAKQGTHLGFV